MSLDAQKLLATIDKGRTRVLARTGAYARTIMRRSIKPQSKAKKNRTVVYRGEQYLVPVRGMVIVAKTRRPVRKEMAAEIRRAFAVSKRGQGEGQPPRRGRSDALRRGILWSIDPRSKSVVIGAEPFAKQPSGLLGVSTVPQLLNYGGGQMIDGVLAKYRARPFAEPALGVARKKMEQEIKKGLL